MSIKRRCHLSRRFIAFQLDPIDDNNHRITDEFFSFDDITEFGNRSRERTTVVPLPFGTGTGTVCDMDNLKQCLDVAWYAVTLAPVTIDFACSAQYKL